MRAGSVGMGLGAGGGHGRRVACPNYLARFCKDGPHCSFGHVRLHAPRVSVGERDVSLRGAARVLDNGVA